MNIIQELTNKRQELEDLISLCWSTIKESTHQPEVDAAILNLKTLCDERKEVLKMLGLPYIEH